MDDKPALGENVGCSFLTDDGIEQWIITALDANSAPVALPIVLTSGDPGTGDGIATTWAFNLT